MKQLRIILLLVCLVFTGCASVITNQPVCDPCHVSNQAAFEGFWMTEDGIFEIRFDSKGTAQLGATDWSDTDGTFSLVTGELRFSGDPVSGYVSARFLEEAKWDPQVGYYLARYRFVGDQTLKIFIPQPDLFIDWIKKGAIQGEYEAGEHTKTARITSTPDVFLTLLKTADEKLCFNETEPLTFKRVVFPEETPIVVATPSPTL